MNGNMRRLVLAGIAPSTLTGCAGVAMASDAEGTRFRDCPECPEMVVVPAGTYMMGSPESESGRDWDEYQREVRIGYRFAVGVYEVTRGEYARFVSETRRSMGAKEGVR